MAVITPPVTTTAVTSGYAFWRLKGFPLVPVLILLFIAFVAIFADVLAPHDPQIGSLARRFKPPFWQEGGSLVYPLGTDHVGRDVLSRLIFGARVSVVVGITAVLVAGLGSTLGYTAWAAKPAQGSSTTGPAAASEADYRVQLQVEVDGEQQQFELKTEAGRPFVFTVRTAAAREWHGTFTARPEGADHVLIAGTLSVDGKQVAAPATSTPLGKPATLRIDQPSGGSFELQVLATRTAGTAKVATAGPQSRTRPSTQPHSGLRGTNRLDVAAATERLSPPRYPSAAFQQGISGKVVLQVEVGADGRPGEITVVSAEPQGVFEENTVAAARAWTFTPAIKDGQPVASMLKVPVEFALDEPGP